MVFLVCMLSAIEGLQNSARAHTVSFTVDKRLIFETQEDEKPQNWLLASWNIVFLIVEK